MINLCKRKKKHEIPLSVSIKKYGVVDVKIYYLIVLPQFFTDLAFFALKLIGTCERVWCIEPNAKVWLGLSLAPEIGC